MNRFVERHRELIDFGYSCFDRIICNGYIQQFQHEERAGTIVWFFRTHHQVEQLSKRYLAGICRAYHQSITDYAKQAQVEIVEAKETRREDFVEPYYRHLGQRHGIAVILKAREPERIAMHYARGNHVTVKRAWVNVYNFYVHDANCGRLFLRICPYFPFNIRFWMNGHHWLACQMQRQGIAFEQRDNTFVACSNPERLQQLANAFGPHDIRAAIAPWLERLISFFGEQERQTYAHRFYMAQMEYCHNLVFHKKAHAHRLLDRLMDVNRCIGHPDKLAVVFGRPCFHPDTRSGQTVIKMTKRRTPVISSSYQSTSIKQYVGHLFRTESTCHQLKDLSVKKHIDNLPRLREVLGRANQRYLEVQQDVLNSYVDRGQLQQLRQPTFSNSGRRIPGLRIDDPRLMALLQAIACFVHLSGTGTFRTKDLLLDMQNTLDNPDYKLSQLRYDLSKLRGKGLVTRIEGTQTYQLTPEGYRVAILYLKLYHRVWAPLTAGLRAPVATDNQVFCHRQAKLDRLYVAVDNALQKLTDYLAIAA